MSQDFLRAAIAEVERMLQQTTHSMEKLGLEAHLRDLKDQLRQKESVSLRAEYDANGSPVEE